MNHIWTKKYGNKWIVFCPIEKAEFDVIKWLDEPRLENLCIFCLKNITEEKDNLKKINKTKFSESKIYPVNNIQKEKIIKEEKLNGTQTRLWN